jgi:hypothetical protein
VQVVIQPQIIALQVYQSGCNPAVRFQGKRQSTDKAGFTVLQLFFGNRLAGKSPDFFEDQFDRLANVSCIHACGYLPGTRAGTSSQAAVGVVS